MKLLERGRELAAIDAVLHRTGGVLLIHGGAGLGKTSLVDAACRRARELGYQVLRSRGSELEVDFASDLAAFWEPLFREGSAIQVSIGQPTRLYRFTGPRMEELNRLFGGGESDGEK